MDIPQKLPSDTPKYAGLFWAALGLALSAALLFVLIAQWPHTNNTDFTPQFPLPTPLRAASPALRQDTAPVAIGILLPLSGEKKEIGTALLRAAEMAVASINADTGFLNIPIRIVTEDGGCDKKMAHLAAQKLLDQKISFIVGGACSEEIHGIETAVRESKSLVLSPSASGFVGSNTGIFRLVPSTQQTEAAQKTFEIKEGVGTLIPYFNEHTVIAEHFFGLYKAHYQEDPIVPWYLANMYSAFFLLQDCAEQFGEDVAACRQWISTLEDWSGGALTTLSFTPQGDAAWQTFVVQEKDWQGITRDISLFTVQKDATKN